MLLDVRITCPGWVSFLCIVVNTWCAFSVWNFVWDFFLLLFYWYISPLDLSHFFLSWNSYLASFGPLTSIPSFSFKSFFLISYFFVLLLGGFLLIFVLGFFFLSYFSFPGAVFSFSWVFSNSILFFFCIDISPVFPKGLNFKNYVSCLASVPLPCQLPSSTLFFLFWCLCLHVTGLPWLSSVVILANYLCGRGRCYKAGGKFRQQWDLSSGDCAGARQFLGEILNVTIYRSFHLAIFLREKPYISCAGAKSQVEC